jgi:hypothetical protein
MASAYNKALPWKKSQKNKFRRLGRGKHDYLALTIIVTQWGNFVT